MKNLALAYGIRRQTKQKARPEDSVLKEIAGRVIRAHMSGQAIVKREETPAPQVELDPVEVDEPLSLEGEETEVEGEAAPQGPDVQAIIARVLARRQSQ